MAVERTAEESKAANVAAMGEELGEVYSALWQDAGSLHVRWAQCLALFGTKLTRVDLLNKAAPAFFRLVQDTLFEAVILQIARMVDPPRTMNKDNLTLQALKELEGDEGVKKSIDAAISQAEAMRDWRNRLLAHRDLAVALGKASEPISAVNIEAIRKAVDAIGGALNAVEKLHLKSETAFSEFIGPLGDAVFLLYVLDDGVRAKDERLQRQARGEYDPKDYPARDL